MARLLHVASQAPTPTPGAEAPETTSSPSCSFYITPITIRGPLVARYFTPAPLHGVDVAALSGKKQKGNKHD